MNELLTDCRLDLSSAALCPLRETVWAGIKANEAVCNLTRACPSPSSTARLNDGVLLGNHHMEHDGFSDRSEREAHDEWDAAANENGGRLTEESDVEQSDEPSPSPGPQATAYVEQSTEEMAEVRLGSNATVSSLQLLFRH